MAIKFGSRGTSRALRILATLGALALVAALPTAAHAKKQHKLKMDPTVPETAEPTGPVPPEADAAGHVNFGNPQAEGIGRVTVKSKTGDKIQVYLEGRYFGDAPVTIYSVPKGDYIVEGTVIGSGKQLSTPVSVSENEEATVELGGGKIETPTAATGGGSGFMSGEITPQRSRLTKIFLVTAAVGVVGAVTFGILEHGAESDFEKASPNDTKTTDDISARGKRDALLCDVGLALVGVGVVGAIVAGYPMFTHANAEKPVEGSPTAFVAPMLGRGTTGAAFSMRF